jgi:hypothetical protein
MNNNITRTLKPIRPPMTTINQYTQQVVKVSTEAISVMVMVSSSNNNGIKAWFWGKFLPTTTHRFLFWWLFLAFNPILSAIGTYYGTIERLIIAASDNPPTRTADTTTIVIMVWLTNLGAMLQKRENWLVGPQLVIENAGKLMLNHDATVMWKWRPEITSFHA